MSSLKLYSAVIVVAFATALAVAATSNSAHAEAPRTAACTSISSRNAATSAEEYMTAQMAEGRTHFAFTGYVLCAW